MKSFLTRALRGDLLLVSVLLLIGVVAGLAGLLEADDDSGYPTIGADLEPLRSAFNSKPDQVRAVLLASPT